MFQRGVKEIPLARLEHLSCTDLSPIRLSPCGSRNVLPGCNDFSFMPIFNGAACGVDLFIGQFHKLILVVGLGAFVSDELVSCAAGCIVDGLFLGEFWLNYPMPHLHATHEVKHIVHSQ